MWDWDLATGEIFWSADIADIADIIECSQEDIGTGVAWWQSRIHPDDLPRVNEGLRRLTALERERWSDTYRVRRGDGGFLIVRNHGFVVRDEARALRVVGAARLMGRASAPDVSMASLLARLEQSERQFHSFVESIPQLAWSATPDGWIDFYNQRWYEYTGTTFEQMEGWGWVSVHDPRDLSRVLKIWRNAVMAGEPWEDEFRIRRASDGVLRWHLARAMPLLDAEGQIIRWFGTTTDIHDQKLAMEEHARLYASEQRARREAERANRAKDEFLATISHELRTPLHAILGWAHLLQSGLLSEDKKKIAIDKIAANARLQGKLIEDLLDVSRIIGGNFRVEREPMDPVSSIQAAIDALKPIADDKRIPVRLFDGARGARVSGSFERLQQVASNLLSNAIKFSAPGQPVDVRVTREGDGVVIVFEDQGRGIDPRFLPQLFQRFRQESSASTRAYSGLGLGLSIVRHLIELHGGSVSAESEGEGKGARFTVRLPLLDAQVATAPVSARAAESMHAMVTLTGIKILVVDDECSARDLLAELLLSCGAAVTLASSVYEALTHFERDRPDVVISDIAMPQVDGYSLVERIRALPDREAGSTPIIALTAFGSLEDRGRALAAGFDCHVAKPFEPGPFSRIIAEIVGQRIRGTKG